MAALAGILLGLGSGNALAWDYEGHRIVNQLALAAMPSDFAPFTREAAARERIAFLAGEPDRWRNTSDRPVKHAASLDHYFDYEQIAMAGMDPAKLPDTRYGFAAAFAAGRKAHLAVFPAIDPAKNADGSAEWPGFAPWTIAESYGKLKAAFSYLKVFEELGTPEEIRNARENIIGLMGVMGHYVGDCAQPLHLTIHHNGWVGDNPKGYTRWPGFHAWIDGGFIDKAGIRSEPLQARVGAAQVIPLTPEPDGRDPMFAWVVRQIEAHHAWVEPLYGMDQKGAFKEEALAKSPEGREFIEARLIDGGRMLAAIWLAAWKSAGPDDYLRRSLEKRRQTAAPEPGR